jgi:hypothetical protein
MPAAFARGANETDAIAALEESLPGYFEWLSRHDEYTPVMRGSYRVALAEALRLTDPTAGAFFQSDAQPMSAGDLDWYTALLEWSYADLTAALGLRPASAWDAPTGGQSPRARAEAVAGGQFWLLSRLGMVAATDAPPDPAAPPADLVARTGATALGRLRAAPHEMFEPVTDRDGECWSLRKLLRRSILLVRSSTADLSGSGRA